MTQNVQKVVKFKAHHGNHLRTLMGKFKLMLTTCLTRGCLKNFFKFKYPSAPISSVTGFAIK